MKVFEQLSGLPYARYKGDATECRFLLGGIGTGNVSVGSRGELCDWEIFGQPGKGNHLPYSFFAIRAAGKGLKQPVARVLEGCLRKPYTRSHGYISGDLAGLPRFANTSYAAAYPFVGVELQDESLPFTASLEAFTPFVPLNVDDSSIPGAVLRYVVCNTSSEPLDVTIAGSLANAVGFSGYDLFQNLELPHAGRNEYRGGGPLKGIQFTCPQLAADDVRNGSMCLATAEDDVTAKEQWLAGGWWDGAHDFWDDFTEDGRLALHSENSAKGGALDDSPNLRVGSLGVCKTVAPGESESFTFLISWHFPNRPKYWGGHICAEDHDKGEVEHNYYATLRPDAWAYADYLNENLPRLEEQSLLFTKALYGSTLPAQVLDAAASNITVLRSPTCFRLGDGTFLSWEGSFPTHGSCEGNCTHVWNYAQTAAFLFPELEQSMRRTEFLLETGEDGNMAFRTMQVFGDEKWDMLPAVDGQMGTILRLYRDWKLSGNDTLLRECWPNAAKALEFAFSYWDSDGDNVLDSRQHNTYDIEFYGPNSLSNSLFFAALEAGARMAEAVGDTEKATHYRAAAKSGSEAMDKALWDGEYYIQVLDDVNEHRYQYGKGCLADQVFGQMLAHTYGLGYVLPKEHTASAVNAVFRHNFRKGMQAHENVQRTYALNDEAGLLLCTWPKGGRPSLPFVYCDEVWSGIEYQVAAHLIYEGFVSEGLELVNAVRNRYNGYDWNPFNEVECGNHYVRSMASWSVLLALSGFGFSLDRGEISFAPKLEGENGTFKCFFSCAKGWGVYTRQRDEANGGYSEDFEVLYGDAEAIRLTAAE